MSDLKFLGFCLVLAAIVVGVAIVYHGRGGPAAPVGRYQFQPSNPLGIIWVIDTTTGEVKTRSDAEPGAAADRGRM